MTISSQVQELRNNQQQSLGETIQRRRVELGMSKTDLAQAMGVHKSNPAHWERGDGPNPDKLPLLAKVLDMPEATLRELHRDGFEAYVRERLESIHTAVRAMSETTSLMEALNDQLRETLRLAEAAGQDLHREPQPLADPVERRSAR